MENLKTFMYKNRFFKELNEIEISKWGCQKNIYVHNPQYKLFLNFLKLNQFKSNYL